MGRWGVLESLANYHSVVKSLLVVLKDMPMTHLHETSHTIAEEAVRALSQDVHVLHDQLVSILRDSESCTSFLACRGSLAQQLLDLLQDLLDSFSESPARSRLSKALERLSRVSGLHPRCFPLTGLEKVDQQIAAGAFGDIWQGLVRGQSVSVKIMRLFRDADMKYALQVTLHSTRLIYPTPTGIRSRSSIWRQLSHPNLLPSLDYIIWTAGSALCRLGWRMGTFYSF
ncbi:hypothetical protein K438DRAFT_1021080 [Mycena galopus ATCC 62051]|nr:hypothetical protein K438DRAFT_1021080 [Mycena galopus ATCC 62051]